MLLITLTDFFYNLTEFLLACDCDKTGSRGLGCDAIGQCDCKENVIGLKCSQCAVSYRLVY